MAKNDQSSESLSGAYNNLQADSGGESHHEAEPEAGMSQQQQQQQQQQPAPRRRGTLALDFPPPPPLDELVKRPEPLPVDRYWLHKLVHKYQKEGNKETLEAIKQRPLLVCAPMVDQSDLPFRLLCRRYGTDICVTPMIHCRQFVRSAKYRSQFLPKLLQADRPLLVQLCGSHLESVVQTALACAPYCDGIDLNCGCPQGIAKRGQYGAYLLEDRPHLLQTVRTLLQYLSIPLSVKVRLLPDPNDPKSGCSLHHCLALYEELVDAGIHLLTVHGRTRYEKGTDIVAADMEAIRLVVQQFSERLPILTNGNVSSLSDAHSCYDATGADGVMSAEALLEYPALFSSLKLSRVQLTRQYLDLCYQHPPDEQGQGSGVKCVKMHLHRNLHADLQRWTDLRTALGEAKCMDDLERVLRQVEERQEAMNHVVASEQLSWYWRHRKQGQAVLLDSQETLETAATTEKLTMASGTRGEDKSEEEPEDGFVPSLFDEEYS